MQSMCILVEYLCCHPLTVFGTTRRWFYEIVTGTSSMQDAESGHGIVPRFS